VCILWKEATERVAKTTTAIPVRKSGEKGWPLASQNKINKSFGGEVVYLYLPLPLQEHFILS
jgi:hypothetical protein